MDPSPGAQVLDLGCGDGSLLRFLKEKRGASGYGIEIDDANILASVRNGVNVLQSDLESGWRVRVRLLRLRDPVADAAGGAPHRADHRGDAAGRARRHRDLSRTSATGGTACRLLGGRMPVSRDAALSVVRHAQRASVHASAISRVSAPSTACASSSAWSWTADEHRRLCPTCSARWRSIASIGARSHSRACGRRQTERHAIPRRTAVRAARSCSRGAC